MSKVLYAFITIMALASCGNSYNIQGSSNVSTLDGRMLYLKVLHDNDFKTIDSCDVVHGQFHFNGSFDSICMANTSWMMKAYCHLCSKRVTSLSR